MKHETIFDLYKTSGNWYRFAVCPNQSVAPNERYAYCSYADTHTMAVYKPSELWLAVDTAGGSDYSGSAVERSNFEYLKKFECKKLVASDNYGLKGYQIHIRGDYRNKEVIEIINSLSDYPVIDEDTMSELESQWQQDNLQESWTQHEVAASLQDFYNIEEVASDTVLDLLYHIDSQGNGLEWENTGNSASLIVSRLDRAYEKLKISDLVTHGVVFDFPDDYDFQSTDHPDLLDASIMRALALSKHIYLFENGEKVNIPDWAYPNPNQLALFQN